MTEKFKTFLEYYRENEVNLTESPMRLGRSYKNELDNNWFNVESAKEIIEDSNFEKVTTQMVFDVELDVYRENYSTNKFQDNWITLQPFIACYFMFEKAKDNGLSALGVWNHRTFKGTVRNLFFSYYLKNFDYVISDNKHTDEGEIYWRKLIPMALKNGNPVKVVTRSGNEYDIDATEEYWGNVNDFSEYRIKIYSIALDKN